MVTVDNMEGPGLLLLLNFDSPWTEPSEASTTQTTPFFSCSLSPERERDRERRNQSGPDLVCPVSSLQVLIGSILAILLTVLLVEMLVSLVDLLTGLCSMDCRDPQVLQRTWRTKRSLFFIFLAS